MRVCQVFSRLNTRVKDIEQRVTKNAAPALEGRIKVAEEMWAGEVNFASRQRTTYHHFLFSSFHVVVAVAVVAVVLVPHCKHHNCNTENGACSCRGCSSLASSCVCAWCCPAIISAHATHPSKTTATLHATNEMVTTFLPPFPPSRPEKVGDSMEALLKKNTGYRVPFVLILGVVVLLFAASVQQYRKLMRSNFLGGMR